MKGIKMSRKKPETKPKITKEFKLVLFEVIKEEMDSGIWLMKTGQTYRLEEIRLFETTDPQTVSLVTSLYEKETEIKRLQSIIQGYKEATDKVMKG